MHTSDGGKSWRAQPTGYDGASLRFLLARRDPRLDGRQPGRDLRTIDGGRSWTNLAVPGDFTLSAVTFADALRGWIAGEFGVIFTTRDGGKSWLKQKSPVEVSFSSGESHNLFALLFPKPHTATPLASTDSCSRTRDGTRWEILRQRSDVNRATGANHLFAAAAFGEGCRPSVNGARCFKRMRIPTTGSRRGRAFPVQFERHRIR